MNSSRISMRKYEPALLDHTKTNGYGYNTRILMDWTHQVPLQPAMRSYLDLTLALQLNHQKRNLSQVADNSKVELLASTNLQQIWVTLHAYYDPEQDQSVEPRYQELSNSHAVTVYK
ncbi:hypothetical protein Y032_0055g2601 [Ancylostoma ceylanicum]|uniref:Uncharacterized protein n=1 Tax=Ancylostoma ceylanicum TaxID=53326 RepID=A0A016U6I8_9BILA|nr:hypothetical protein Y032_0055g2601 [Ancylostoma ceylanicum]